MTIEEIQNALPPNASPAAVELGKRIRQVRQTRHVTARELSHILKIHVGSIYHWERGVYAPGALNLQKTAIILGMPVEFFLGLDWRELESRTESGDQVEQVGQLIRQIGQQFGETNPTEWAHWSPPALSFLVRVLQFGLSPNPNSLSSLLNQHPLAGDTESDTPPMLRWTKRSGLVEWLLSATDAGLDVVEDVVRRLAAK